MGTLPSHDLAILGKKDSWELFKNRAFAESEATQQFIEIGQKIVDKCAGLPLALKAIGALMRYNRELPEWHAISENHIWDDEASTNEILPALKLSYNHLPGYMKQCFAFCAIFPQDYEIEKETLIQLWMANDFIPTNEISDVERKGRDIFDELCQRSFFQEIHIQDSFKKNKTTCKMHDLMHDLAKQIAGKQCIVTLAVESCHLLHVSIIGKELSDNLNSILKRFPVFRTCLVNKYYIEGSKDRKTSDFLKSIPLRALKVSLGNQFPNELRFMKHLRYLDLSDSIFDSLPESVSALYNLQTLKLSNSKISKLPDNMRYMVSLRHLFINDCWSLKRIPSGLGKLRCLMTLTDYMVECGPGRTVGELNNLNLHGSLKLSGLENVTDINEANAANMISKINLFSLTLKWSSQKNNGTTGNDQEVLDGLRPSTELKELVVDGYAGFDIPVWMKNASVLSNIRKLHFICCCNCTVLPPIWCLSLLEELWLSNMKSLVYICSSHSIEDKKSKHLTMFPKLKFCYINELDNLKGWHEKNDKLLTFPQLEKLTIRSCPQIRTIPCAPLLEDVNVFKSRGIKLLQISNLAMAPSSELDIVCVSSMEHDAFRPPKNVVRMSVTGFENVIPLEDNVEETCQKQTLRHLNMETSNCFFSYGPCKLALGFWKYFVSLETLWIRDCNDLSLWPEQEFKNLKCLKKLSISDCNNFTCLSDVLSSSIKSYGEDILPRLEYLSIWRCPKMAEIPRCKSLKTLHLWDCCSVSKEGFDGLKNLHELRELILHGSKVLKSLPEGMEDLTSLQYLYIWCYPGIESFQGLQQRLSALQSLTIKMCPVLQRRCGSGGDYHHLVSIIPNLNLMDC